MNDEELKQFVKLEKPAAHNCRKHLYVCDSEYPPHVNVIATKCRICGYRFYDAIKPQVEDKFAKVCPAAYRNTEPHKLPNPTKLHSCLKWKFGSMGLLLHGKSGAGKSRCAWMVLKREINAGKTVMALDFSISYEYSETFAKNASDATKWIAKYASPDILLLDDVFKAKLSDGLEQAIYTIIGLRTEAERPIFVTCNDVGETLLARMSPDRGPALIRRLREYCEVIAF